MLLNNPLTQYFRQPSIYIKLPSQGNFYPDGTLDIPPNGELPVYPMTAIDEITYRTPDALYNGSAVVSVIQSCVPSIKNAWYMPAVDIDTVLVAIRIASYGHSLETESQCPSCKNVAEYGVDLRSVLDNLKAPNYESVLRFGDMEFYFRPLTYKDVNDNNQLQFEEQRMLQAITNAEMNEADKVKTISQALNKITEITIKSMALSVAAVKTPSALVTDQIFIDDLLKNCDRSLFTQLRDHILSLKKSSEFKPTRIKCSECDHEYDQSITLDMTNFFADAS
jgi:hypothetical protein